MNNPRLTVSKSRFRRLETRVETVLEAALAVIGPFVAHVKKSQNPLPQ